MIELNLQKLAVNQAVSSVETFLLGEIKNNDNFKLKIIKTDCAKKIPMFKGLHRFLPAMVLLQKGTVLQIPIQHYPRIAGKTKFGIRNRLLGSITDCFAYLWMKKKYINYEVIKKE